MLDWLIEFFPSSYHVLYVATFIVAAFLFVSGLDDVFIDLYYWFHYLLNRKNFTKYTRESPEKLHEVEEKPIAIFVPAWNEFDVIDKMVLEASRGDTHKTKNNFSRC